MPIHTSPARKPLSGLLIAGRYKVGRRLSDDKAGEVYEAHREDMGQRLALRVTPPAGDAQQVQRFVERVRRTARIEHPSVNPIFDVGILPDGRGFAAMQFVDGVTLDTLLAQEGGRLEPSLAMHLIERLAGALGEAHQQGIVHGSIGGKRVRVGARRGRRMTVTLLGFDRLQTPSNGGPPETPADDVLALGKVFWRLLTGKPWTDGRMLEWPTRSGQIPPAIRHLVARMVSQDLDERPANGSAVIGSLQLAQAELASSGRKRTALTPTDPPRLHMAGRRRELRETPHKQVSQPRLQDFAQARKGDRPEEPVSGSPLHTLGRARRVTPVHARPRAQRPLARGNMIRPDGRSATALVSAAGPSGIITTVLASGPDLVLGATVHLTLQGPGAPFTLSARIVKVSADGPRGPLVLTLVLDPRDADYPRYAATYPRWQKA